MMNETIPLYRYRYRFSALLVFSCVLVMTSACATPPAAKPTSKPISWRNRSLKRVRNHNLATTGLAAETLDSDDDGKPNRWTYYPATPDGKPAPGTKKVRVERDIDGDGVIDMWSYYGRDGKMSEEEIDIDGDGVIDVVKFYVSGILDNEMWSPDYSERFSIRRFYSPDGALLRIERDLDGDEATDVAEEYQDGKLVRIKRDTNHDGKFDVVEEEE